MRRHRSRLRQRHQDLQQRNQRSVLHRHINGLGMEPASVLDVEQPRQRQPNPPLRQAHV